LVGSEIRDRAIVPKLTVTDLIAPKSSRQVTTDDDMKKRIYRLIRQPSLYHGKIPSLKMAMWMRPQIKLITERFNFVEPVRGSFFDNSYVIIDVVTPAHIYDKLTQHRHHYHRSLGDQSPIYLMEKEQEMIDGQDRITVLDDESPEPQIQSKRSRRSKPLTSDIVPMEYFPRFNHLSYLSGPVTTTQFNIALTYYERQQQRLVDQIGIMTDDNITTLATALEKWFLRIEEPVADSQFRHLHINRNCYKARGYSYYCHVQLIDYLT
jgi:hypothetical protein